MDSEERMSLVGFFVVGIVIGAVMMDRGQKQ